MTVPDRAAGSGRGPAGAPGSGVPLGPPCPRCGRRAAVDSGPFCPWCGRYLAGLRWVAVPPAAAEPLPAPPRPPYTGPPGYRYVPRWGFPPHPAPAAGSGVAVAPPPYVPARVVAGVLVPLLRATAVIALVGVGAEAWRYVLLLQSRDRALSATTVATSDALVTSAGVVGLICTLLSGGLLMLWSVRATTAAAAQARVRPARRVRALLLGWLVPGLNLAVPGAVLAEIEHTATGQDPHRRPRPGRELLVWWGLWTASVVLAAVVALWSWRGGVQAMADGVVLHAAANLLAVATALVTARVVLRLTRLLGPSVAGPRAQLVALGGS